MLGTPERSALPRCVRSIQSIRSDRWVVPGSRGLSVRWCRGHVAGTSAPMSHQAGAGAESPGQHLSIADRRDREQSAVAEGEERSTSVALSPGQLRGTAGRHRRSAREDHWGTNTRGDCWGVRLSGGTPRFKNRPRGRVSPRLRLACWCRTSSCCRPGSGLRLDIARQRHRVKGPAPPRHPALSVGAHVQLKCVHLVSRVVPRLHIRLSSCTYATTLTAPTRSATGDSPTSGADAQLARRLYAGAVSVALAPDESRSSSAWPA